VQKKQYTGSAKRTLGSRVNVDVHAFPVRPATHRGDAVKNRGEEGIAVSFPKLGLPLSPGIRRYMAVTAALP
jgi:hypothetical protein